jgi:hyperosmotically inducible protein
MKHNTLQSYGLPLAAALVLGLGISVVRAEDSSTPHSDSIGTAISDTAITASVKGKMLGDDRLKGADISVKTTNGVVTLTGTAPSGTGKQAAEGIASAVDGVKSVDNEVVTASGSKTTRVAKADVAKAERVGSDTWITTKVKSSLIADDVSRGLSLNVTTKNGVVNLHGAVPSQDAQDHVKDMAAKIDGVKSVNTTDLRIRRKAE